MSEKINELIKSVKDLKYDSSTGTFETDRRALFEFAELIVRECIKEMGRYEFIDVAMREVKEHFGVE
jgi:hypothetical protein